MSHDGVLASLVTAFATAPGWESKYVAEYKKLRH
jgi:hypothetical protein